MHWRAAYVRFITTVYISEDYCFCKYTNMFSGVNFTNILRAALMRADPERAK
jgi:hypothetical protein